ncbi:MAG TPA: DUF1080 domain-containing protein [Isosphaeraceae bacterium]|jgi:hypothetical protein|nr:DUF1080 domain-containing protein [Isosphaeraceae bacterium]
MRTIIEGRAQGIVMALAAIVAAGAVAVAAAGQGDWKELTGPGGLDAWKKPTGAWEVVGGVRTDPKDPTGLVAEPGTGVIYNGPRKRTSNLVTRESFGDVEVHAEFLIPKGSNSGIKLEGAYEVQILDSYGKATVKASDCGGIYPRAELLPKYHYLDDGFPPRVNAAKPAGEWQTLDITFRAPRFDARGKKTADARFEKVVLNGRVVQEDVAVPTPTGHAWHDKESPTGPILLQADHGPVAFRNLRVRPLPASSR